MDKYLAQKAQGAIMEGLNMGIIKEMPVPLAPIDLQLEFAERLRRVSEQRAAERRLEVNLAALFGSLQRRAFRGEL